MTTVASPAAAHDHAAPKIPIPEVLADCMPQPPADAAAALGDWRFDKWLAETCGMVTGAEAIAKLATTTRKTESLQPHQPALVPLASDRSFARDLSDLTCEEPVDIHSGSGQEPLVEDGSDVAKDVAVMPPEPVASAPPTEHHPVARPAQSSMPSDPPATAPPKLGSLALLGSSPIIATLPDTYLAYDLSPEDAIAMRMYPIDQPSPNYSAARRTSVYGAVAALEVSPWRIVSEPAVTVSTAGLAGNAFTSTAPPAKPVASAAPTEADEWLAVLASQVVQAVQPDSEVRSRLRPRELGTALGQWSQRSSSLADGLMANLTSPSVQGAESALSSEAATLIAQAELQAPRPANAPAAAPLLPTSEGRVLQVELACQAAIEVVMAQAARSPQAEPAQPLAAAPVDSVARAAAVATVCDQAAASLEKLAMAIRRAGDSWVRQAQVNAGNGSLLR